jgi:putative component of toxin-antitoxin plasmid stabilization module
LPVWLSKRAHALVGGDKRSQKKDINQAKQYRAQYVEDAKHGKT